MEKLIYCKIIKFDHLKNSKCTKSNFSLLENIMYEEIVIFYFKWLLNFLLSKQLIMNLCRYYYKEIKMNDMN